MSSTSNTQASDAETPTIRTSQIVKHGALALVGAVLVNGVLVLFANVAGIAPDLTHLEYGRIAVFTSGGVVGATALYALLVRFVRTPDRTFTRIAIGLLVLSVIPTAVIIPGEPGATLLGTVLLGVMHVPPAVASIAFLTGRVFGKDGP